MNVPPKPDRKQHAGVLEADIVLRRANNTATVLSRPSATVVGGPKNPTNRPVSLNTSLERLRVAETLIYLQSRDPKRKSDKITKGLLYKLADLFGRNLSAVEKDIRYARRLAGGRWWQMVQRHEREAFRIEQMTGALDAAIKAKAAENAVLNADEARNVSDGK
jgi:hypothetical protein